MNETLTPKNLAEFTGIPESVLRFDAKVVGVSASTLVAGDVPADIRTMRKYRIAMESTRSSDDVIAEIKSIAKPLVAEHGWEVDDHADEQLKIRSPFSDNSKSIAFSLFRLSGPERVAIVIDVEESANKNTEMPKGKVWNMFAPLVSSQATLYSADVSLFAKDTKIRVGSSDRTYDAGLKASLSLASNATAAEEYDFVKHLCESHRCSDVEPSIGTASDGRNFGSFTMQIAGKAANITVSDFSSGDPVPDGGHTHVSIELR